MINVLSCFDGISAGRLALGRAGVEVNKYYRSEVDKFADKVAMHHFPNDVQLGDVTKWREWNIDWSSIDMLIGGSPCQGFSFAGKQAGTKAVLNGEEILVTDREKYLEMKSQGAEFLSQSHLFWEFVLILDHIKLHNPNVKFLLENVKMKKELLEMIDTAMGVKSVVINSALVSGQNRVRHYWCNWEITQPEDKGILLKDVLEDTVAPEFELSDAAIDYMGRLRNGKPRWEYHKNPVDGKAACLTANMHKGVPYGALRLYGASFNRKDGIGKELNKPYCLNASDWRGLNRNQNQTAIVGELLNESATKQGKAYTLKASQGNCVAWNSCERKQRTMVPVCESDEKDPNVYNGIYYRKLTPTECARLQTFPDGWCESVVSNSQSYKAYGNSWTVDVIAHIFKCM